MSSRFSPSLPLLGALLLALPLAAQGAAPVRAPAAARLANAGPTALDSIVRSAMSDQSIPGMSLAIVREGRVVLEKGYGRAGSAGGNASADTRYQIASVTKQFTAAAVLRLAERGALDLDEPVTHFVAGLPAEYQAVTLRRLLNHTAGVPNFTDFFHRFRRPLTPTQVVDSLAYRRLLFAPGSGFRYSNSGYYLLGLVIEHTSGQRFADFLRAEFWQPLGMNDTDDCGMEPRLPAGYARNRRGAPVPAAPWDPSVLYAAGSVCSTVADLARWVVALGEGRVLSAASYQEMTTPAPPSDSGVRMSYGYAMMVDSTEAGPYLHHDGAVAGFRAQVAWYPRERLAVVLLMNQGMAAPEPIERDLARAVMGAAPAEPPPFGAEAR